MVMLSGVHHKPFTRSPVMRRLVLFVCSGSMLRVFLGVIALLLFLLAGRPVRAAARVWSGAGASAFWDDTGNWVAGVTPISGDALFFPGGTLNLTNTNNIANLRLGPVTFGGTNFQITGSASVTNDGGILCPNAP